MIVGSLSEEELKEIVTLKQPLGPRETEPLVGKEKIFLALYDETNGVHREATMDDPYYVVGRKGAGKTAFLVGAALAHEADVARIKSEDVYTQVNKLLIHYSKAHGGVVADELAYVWEVLLFHAAMLSILRSDRPYEPASARTSLWNYMKAFGDPDEIQYDDLFAAVVSQMSDALHASSGTSFRSDCWSIAPSGRSFAEAVNMTREILGVAGPKAVYVVVDNLEDLHWRLDEFAPVVSALFRLVGRSATGDGLPIPFSLRFAFPAELLSRLADLAANAGKDFRERLTVRWRAHELMAVVGNRLRTFLDLYFPSAPKALGLPRVPDPRDTDAAHATLRALLPDVVENKLGGRENADAYLMRHTQLLPRHLVIMLNHVMSNAVAGLDSDAVPQITAEQLVQGIAEAEFEILAEILSSYSYAHPKVKYGLEAIKNEIAIVEKTSTLHNVYNRSGVAKKQEFDFTEFLRAAFDIGALGVVTERGQRYTQGIFSYTFVRELRPVENEDDVCVHPLFAALLFDPHTVERMASRGYNAIYPYGSDPEHTDVQT